MRRRTQALAKRVFLRWSAYEREHHERVPVSPALSRLFELVPEYEPYRARKASKQRGPVNNPGIFTVQDIAASMDTTVGALLGEPGYHLPRELLTAEELRTVKDAVLILRRMLDLDDPAL